MATNSFLPQLTYPKDLGYFSKVFQLRCGAFANDLKLDVVKNTRKTTQDIIGVLANWAEAHHEPLSIEKSCVIHCGRNQPNHAYMLCGLPVTSAEKIADFGVIRSPNASYSNQYQAVAAKAMRTTNVIRRSFSTGIQRYYGTHFNQV